MSYVLSNAKLDATGHHWLAELSLYDLKIYCKPGKSNTDVDEISRLRVISPDLCHVVDREAITAMCDAIICQHMGCVELLCVSYSVVEENEYDVYPMDQEKVRSALCGEIFLEDPVLEHLFPLMESGIKPEMSTTTQVLQPHIREWDKLCTQDEVLDRVCKDPDMGTKTSQLLLP